VTRAGIRLLLGILAVSLAPACGGVSPSGEDLDAGSALVIPPGDAGLVIPPGDAGVDAGVDGGTDGGPALAEFREVVLRIYESASLHANLATSHHFWMAYDDKVENWSCVQLSLDGTSPPAVLPTGTHTFAARFDRCTMDFLVGTSLDGSVSSAYTATDLNDLVSQVSVHSMRGKLAAYRSDLFDVTADGSGSWRRVRTGPAYFATTVETTTYAPSPGATLTNNATGRVATFAGGSYTQSSGGVTSGRTETRERFDELELAVGGTCYSLNGSLTTVHWNDGRRSYVGEILLTSGGTLVARISADATGARQIEILSPLAPF
jgi:hypothetical protein